MTQYMCSNHNLCNISMSVQRNDLLEQSIFLGEIFKGMVLRHSKQLVDYSSTQSYVTPFRSYKWSQHDIYTACTIFAHRDLYDCHNHVTIFVYFYTSNVRVKLRGSRQRLFSSLVKVIFSINFFRMETSSYNHEIRVYTI